MSQKQLKFKFSSKTTYNMGFKDGFKDRKMKTVSSEEYKRGYAAGRSRRNVDL